MNISSAIKKNQEGLNAVLNKFLQDWRDNNWKIADTTILKSHLLSSQLSLLESVARECEKQKKDYYWCGENPETEEMEKMDKNEPNNWGADMSFGYNQSLSDLQDLIRKEIKELKL